MSGLLRFILGDRLAFSMSMVGRESPRRATYFSLLRHRGVGKRKATPLSATLRCATGNLRWRASAGVWLNSPSAQTTPALIPPPPTIAGASRRGWGPIPPSLRSANANSPYRRCAASRDGSQRSDASRTPDPSPPPLDAPRSGGFGGSGLALSEPQASLARPRRTRAPQVSRSVSAGTQTVGAISFSLVFLVRARKSDSPPGDSRPAASIDAPGE